MSKAHQDRIVAVMRASGFEGRWSVARLSKETGIGKADVARAVQSLRYAGKMEFDALRLMPSMMESPALEESDAGRTGAASIAADAQVGAGVEVHDDGMSGGHFQSPSSAPASAPQDLRSEIAAEAREASRRRRSAGVNGGGTGKRFGNLAPLAPLTPAEQLLTIANGEFAEFAGHLKRRWPGLWYQAVETARRQDSSALRVLFEAVRLGLERMAERQAA